MQCTTPAESELHACLMQCLRAAMRDPEQPRMLELRKEYVKLFSIASSNSQVLLHFAVLPASKRQSLTHTNTHTIHSNGLCPTIYSPCTLTKKTQTHALKNYTVWPSDWPGFSSSYLLRTVSGGNVTFCRPCLSAGTPTEFGNIPQQAH